VRNKSLDFCAAHVFGVAFFVEEDVAANPFDVGLFGALGVVFDADGIADLFEEFFALRGGWCLGRGRWILHVDL